MVRFTQAIRYLSDSIKSCVWKKPNNFKALSNSHWREEADNVQSKQTQLPWPAVAQSAEPCPALAQGCPGQAGAPPLSVATVAGLLTNRTRGETCTKLQRYVLGC